MGQDRLGTLRERGQSIWLDYIDRRLVTSGELQRLIDERHVTGLTSNPTIFAHALSEGDDYDEQIRTLVAAGMTSLPELFVELSATDIQSAADILRPIWERTHGEDGYVSLEVAPGLAHDTERTVAAAHLLWERVERPNLMVKIPATPEGMPAIEQCIADGLNINVTLIFALSAYEAVADAYIRGLERRAAAGKSLDVHSVASFFVSRVDTAVDRRLEQLLAERGDDPEIRSLLGRAGIANSVLAYERFEQIFHGERFRSLRQQGASVQRMLWASTSAKNPRYRDVYIAEALIGPDTIDTMPPQTLEAFADHGMVAGDTVRSDYAAAHRVMEQLAALGIDMEAVTRELLDEGVAAFQRSYLEVLEVIGRKVDGLRGGPVSRQHLDLGPATAVVLDRVRTLGYQGLVDRIWSRDPDCWKPGDAAHAAVIGNRLGWLDLPHTMVEHLDELRRFAAEVADEGVADVVLLGMGGSSLCPEVLRTAVGSAPGYPRLHVLDTTDPVTIDDLTRTLELGRTLFLVASKSGTTVETLSHLGHFWEVLERSGHRDVHRFFVAITDPGTPLDQLARQRNFRRVFLNPADVGGRYSALSYFGLVPAAVSGIDVATLVDRAAAMRRQCLPEVLPALNCGLVLGVAMATHAMEGRDKLTLLASPQVASFGLWAEQLLAESTGKEGKGIVPVADEPVGAPTVYGDDRLFVALRLSGDRTLEGTLDGLRRAGQPVIVFDLADPLDLGAEFFRWEFATAVAGAVLGIDPFDEPNVQEAKDNTRRLLQAYEDEGKLLGDDEVVGDATEVLTGLLAHVRPGDYVALQAYLSPTEANHTALQELRVAIRDRFRVATTLGFGPRFLHSTGQLHKGGPPTGVFLQLTADPPRDVPIPGAAYSFAVLWRAQALGDLEALRRRGRRVARAHLGGDPVAALRQLAAAVGAAGAVPGSGA